MTEVTLPVESESELREYRMFRLLKSQLRFATRRFLDWIEPFEAKQVVRLMLSRIRMLARE